MQFLSVVTNGDIPVLVNLSASISNSLQHISLAKFEIMKGSGFRKYHACWSYLEVCFGEYKLKFTDTKAILCKNLSLVLTTLAIFIAPFLCCLTGGGAESGPGKHGAAFFTFLVSKTYKLWCVYCTFSITVKNWRLI